MFMRSVTVDENHFKKVDGEEKLPGSAEEADSHPPSNADNTKTLKEKQIE